MDSKKFVEILIKEVYEYLLNSNLETYSSIELGKAKGLTFETKTIFDRLNDNEKDIFLKAMQSNVDDSIAILLSIIDQWGGGIFMMEKIMMGTLNSIM